MTPNPTTPSVPQGTPETLRALAHSIPELAPNVDLFDIFADAWEADRRRLEAARPFVEAAAEEAFTGPEWAAKAKAWLAPQGEEGT
jgi:hypothetical protein